MSRQVAISKGHLAGLRYGFTALLVVGAATIGGTSAIGTANAGCVTASGTASVDCDGIQHGQLSGSTIGAVDGQGPGVEDYTGAGSVDGSGSYVDGQAIEDSDGTQGDFCGAMAGSIPRCS
ncbi:MAG: hypothetical protein WCP30_00785 [Mycobacteriaceae bacterium]